MRITTLNIASFEQVFALFCDAFEEDDYYQNLLKSNNKTTLLDMKDVFAPAILFCLQEDGYSYGVYDGDTLIAFLLTTNLERLRCNKTMYETMFGLDSSDKNDIKKNMLQDCISGVKNSRKTVYCMSIAVAAQHRKKGIASALIDTVINNFPQYDIIGDVSNKSSLAIYQARNFTLKQIGDDYFFIHRRAAKTGG